MELPECKKNLEVLCYICGLYTPNKAEYRYSTKLVGEEYFTILLNLNKEFKLLIMFHQLYAETVIQCLKKKEQAEKKGKFLRRR